MNNLNNMKELSEKLDYLSDLTKSTKKYYAQLLRNNNEVPYILGQLTNEIALLNEQVSLYENNVSKFTD